MSSTWMLIRGASANPSSLKFAALMNKQNIAENEIFIPEKKQPSIISTHTEDTVVIQDPFFFKKLKQKTIHYRGGYEPDGTRLRLWCKFDHIASKMKDRAMSVNLEDDFLPGNVLRPNGNPKLCEGPDFDGIKGGSIVTRLNSNPNIIDYYSVSNPESMNLGIVGSFDMGHVGFSMFFRFMLEGEPVQHNGVDPTLWYHADNFDYGTMVRIGENKELKFFILNNTTPFNFISPANAVIPNAWTTACLTYRFSDNAMTMTINNIPQTDSANETPTFDGVENNVIIGASQYPFDAGRFVGRLDDIRWYTDLIFSRDHETNIWNNGRSICAAPVLEFDGVDDNMDLTNDATLWSQSLTQFAFSFWIYPTVFGSGANLLCARHGNVAHGFECDMDSTVNGQIFFIVRNSVNTSFEANNGSSPQASPLILNKWNQIICSYNNSLGSANVRIYVNGVLGSVTANLTEAINLSAVMELGGPSADFKGYMKDFRWWTNDSFNIDEASDFFNHGTMPSTPNYWLKMNEGVGFPVDYITRTKTVTMDTVWTMGSSIRPIEYGSLSVAGYARFNDTVDTGGFDSTGFDTTGFDTT